jgi:hypothetical protein
MSNPCRITVLFFGTLWLVSPVSEAVDVDSPYGVVAFIPSPTRWDAMRDADIVWGRCGFSWRDIETAKGVFNWATTDEAVALANARGLQIYAGLGYTPGWASAGHGQEDPPTNPQDWYDFCFACVSRYKDSIHYWELWNEPNISGFWDGGLQGYIDIVVKYGADAIHAADPEARVLGPEISRCCSGDYWMTQCLQKAGDKIDIICHHQYDYVLPANRLSASSLSIDQMHNLILSLGYGNKPIWVTECGWASDESGMTEQKQADYLTQMLAGMQARSSWWHKFFWYQIWEGPTGRAGLLYMDETRKPAWYAYHDYTAAHPAPEQVSANMSASDINKGMTRVVVGDGDTVATILLGRSCRRNDNSGQDFYIYFDVDDVFAYAGDRPAVTIICDYYDGGSGPINLDYDSTSGPYTNVSTINRAGINTWKQARWTVTDAYFGNRQNNGADFRISGGTSNTFYVDTVAVDVPPRVGPDRASNPAPAHQSGSAGINADLSWTAGARATSHDVYFGTSNPPPSRGNQAATTYDPGTMVAGATYYWRIDEVNTSGTTTGLVWRFTTIPMPGPAANPNPQNGATNVGVTADLTWTAGANATSHDVFFGTTNPPPSQGTQTTTTYDPGTLIRGTTYYWRIDEVNASGTAAGAVWSFKTWGSLADFNWDGDVDQADFGHLQACLSGSGVSYGPGCQDADLVIDGTVDAADLARFLSCVGGTGEPPGC